MLHMPLSKKQRIAKQDWQSALRRLEGAYADGTLRAYRADVQIYATWCEKKGLGAFPAKTKHIAQFVSHEAQRCSAATIKRRLAAIGKIHRLMKLQNPIADEDVKLVLRRELRKKSTRPKQALGMTRELRDRLIDCCDISLAGKRDKAIIALAYDGLLRRSEIVSINLEDLSITESGGKVIIRRSKNDQLGTGRVAHISLRTMKLISNWVEAAKLREGSLFRAIQHNNIALRGLHPHSIGRIIKQAAQRAGFPIDEVKNLSGHSMRIGAAQDMVTAGLDILPIMAAGGWKTTNVVARYIENADLSPLLNRFRQ
jgi:integrase/recombinase XerD